MKINHITIKETASDQVFTIIVYVAIVFILIIVVYPLWFMVMASVSDPTAVNSGKILLVPDNFSLLGYQFVLKDNRIWIGYKNTLIYTVFGTLLGTFVNLAAGYSFSRNDLPGRNFLMGIFVFTMYFSGGLIPFYLVIKTLDLVNTRLLMVLLGSMSVYNIIIIRSFFKSTLPIELQEAAFIDGCSNQRFFFSIVVPLSKAIIAVIALYCAVSYWNAYFNAMIFITDADKKPLQLYLRDILLVASTYQETAAQSGLDAKSAALMEQMSQVVKYGVIVVSTLPIICVYPFLQKYFIKGVLIGAIKG